VKFIVNLAEKAEVVARTEYGIYMYTIVKTPRIGYTYSSGNILVKDFTAEFCLE